MTQTDRCAARDGSCNHRSISECVAAKVGSWNRDGVCRVLLPNEDGDLEACGWGHDPIVHEHENHERLNMDCPLCRALVR